MTFADEHESGRTGGQADVTEGPARWRHLQSGILLDALAGELVERID